MKKLNTHIKEELNEELKLEILLWSYFFSPHHFISGS
jgi:hypothetical protein